MSYQIKDNTFSLFKNDRKDKPSHPDYRGDGMVNGVSVRVAAWIKDGRNGKFMSCSVTPKDDRRERDRSDSYDEPF